MSKIFATVVIAGCLYLNASAQKTLGKLLKISHHRKVAVKDTVIMNFKICKSDGGYAICGQTPGNYNSTFEEPRKPVKHPVYEEVKSNVIELKTIAVPPKVTFPMDKLPETESGEWIGICSWNGIW